MLISDTQFSQWEADISVQGFVLLPQMFAESEIEDLKSALQIALNQESEAIRQREGQVYAVRNVLQLFPQALSVWRKPDLIDFLKRMLGAEFGLVRALYFDKPPQQTWALPWHKDQLIAVQQASVQSERYSPPRLRIGVPHTEPPVEVLEQMLTLRIHLDDVTSENGPLEVLPESHRTGKELKLERYEPQAILCAAGDVLAMRPLLVHSSGCSVPGTQRQRRILHLEFAAWPELPDGVKWWEFYPG